MIENIQTFYVSKDITCSQCLEEHVIGIDFINIETDTKVIVCAECLKDGLTILDNPIHYKPDREVLEISIHNLERAIAERDSGLLLVGIKQLKQFLINISKRD